MASSKDSAEYVCDQIWEVGDIVCRKMFGWYDVYCDGKVIDIERKRVNRRQRAGGR